MSYRASASQPVADPQWSGTREISDQQQHGDELHIMPNSLRRIPDWYQASRFRYNARLIVGVAPGLFLLLTVTGKTMFGAIVAGAFLTIFVRYLQQSWISMALSVGHVIVLEVVNVYCMAPLIWRSILNLPLYGLFHIFIGVAGIFWWLQDDELLRHEPRFTILLEKVLFCLCPPLFVTMVTWIAGILFGKSILPLVVVASGFLAFSLFLVPLQSSFAKPNTPANTGLIQHKVVVWLYSFLLLTVPALMFVAMTFQHTIQFYLMVGLSVFSPVCLLSLLEAQGLGDWFMTGSWPNVLQYVRMVSASVVILLVSGCVVLTQPSSFLPHLLLPILFVTVTLAALTDPTSPSRVTLVVGGILALLYGVAFTQLPWSIKYVSKFLWLPLTLVQLLLWSVALAAAILMTCWTKATPTFIFIFNAVFILCEFILSADNVYPHYLAFITASAAIFTFWRLHSIHKLDVNTSLAVICLHLTKLSLLYPCEHSPSMLTSTVLPLCSTFLTSFVLLRLLLFDHTPSLTWGQLLSYSGLLFVGLLLSVDTFVSPLWATLTHTLPSSATLLAFVLGTVAVYVSYGCGLLGPQEKPPLFLTSLPPGLAVVSTLLALLQPQFSLIEMMESFLVIIGDKTYVPDDSYLLAWTNLLTWLILFSMVLVLIQLVYPQWPAMTPVSVSFLGVLSGFHFSISLAESPPESVGSLLYAFILGLGGALSGRALTGRHKRKWIDFILFISLCTFSACSYFMEWRSKEPVFIPGLSLWERYKLPSVVVIALSFLSVAVSFRLAMHRSGKDEPYLPVLGNIACLAFFLTAPLHKFHQQSEIIVLFCSLVFLLSQPDGYLRPKTSYIFFAPSLLFSLVVLYIIALTNIFLFLFNHMSKAPQIVTAGRVAELIFLFLSTPGQAVFLQSLWLEQNTLPPLSGSTCSANRVMLLLFLLPCSFLPQFSSTMATSIVGSIGIFSFCLAIVSNTKLNLFQ